MTITNISITVLSTLDIALLISVPLLDKGQWYRNVSKPASQRFFCNTVHDEPVNYFILSKGGVLLMTAGLLYTPRNPIFGKTSFRLTSKFSIQS